MFEKKTPDYNTAHNTQQRILQAKAKEKEIAKLRKKILNVIGPTILTAGILIGGLNIAITQDQKTHDIKQDQIEHAQLGSEMEYTQRIRKTLIEIQKHNKKNTETPVSLITQLNEDLSNLIRLGDNSHEALNLIAQAGDVVQKQSILQREEEELHHILDN